MVSGLRALLSGILDYAGLFPPAALPFDQAICNYARYRRDPDSWMLARFICPASRLTEVTPYVKELFDARVPFYFSALGRGGKNADEFRAGLQADLDNIRSFRNDQGGLVVGDVLETRLPATAAVPTGSGPLFARSLGDLACYIEAVPGSDWPVQVRGVLDAIRQTAAPERTARGFKRRCGGLEAPAFPPPEQVASAIAACRDVNVPLKFTAGLHHPIRHFNAGVKTHMHGFINVFVAGVLAHARGLSAEQIQAIIEDEDARSFRFDDAGLCWKDKRATTREIATARQVAVTSFGSCSFDEPRDDLRALGWL
jgi:hypothetical protein